MGRILKQNDIYYVEFLGNGLRFQKKAGPSLEAAEAKLREIEQTLAATALPEDLSAVRVGTFAERFWAYMQQVHTVHSQQRYKEAGEPFFQFLGFQSYMKDITPRVIEEYQSLLRRRQDAAAVNFALLLIRDILEYARSLRFLNDNPTQHVRFLREGIPTPPAVLEEPPVGLSPLQQEAFQFVRETGVTAPECQALCWQDISWKEHAVSVAENTTEGTRIRRIPLAPAVAAALKKRAKAPQEKIFSAADLASLPFEELRHTFAKNLLQRGVKLFELNRYLDMPDIADVLVYLAFLPEDYESGS